MKISKQGNIRTFQEFAKDAQAEYSPFMGWLLLDNNGDLYYLREPQGQTIYTGRDKVIAEFGDCYSAHGQGGKFRDATHEEWRRNGKCSVRITTAKAYAQHLGIEFV